MSPMPLPNCGCTSSGGKGALSNSYESEFRPVEVCRKIRIAPRRQACAGTRLSYALIMKAPWNRPRSRFSERRIPDLLRDAPAWPGLHGVGRYIMFQRGAETSYLALPVLLLSPMATVIPLISESGGLRIMRSFQSRPARTSTVFPRSLPSLIGRSSTFPSSRTTPT